PAPSLYFLFFHCARHHRDLHSFPTRRSSDLGTSTTRWLAFTAFLILVRKSAIGSVIIILIFRIWFSAIPIIIRAKPLPSYNSTFYAIKQYILPTGFSYTGYQALVCNFPEGNTRNPEGSHITSWSSGKFTSVMQSYRGSVFW